MDASTRVLLLFTVLLLSSGAMAEERTLIILHTNDTHSQIDHRWNDELQRYVGEAARRVDLIRRERAVDPKNTLVLDAGDFCQGTPYYTIFGGRLEVDLFNRTDYDAVTLGNHEFDRGLDTLAMLLDRATFDVVCSNLDFTGSSQPQLAERITRYKVIERGGMRIGIFGLLVDPKLLIREVNFGTVVWSDPVEVAREMVAELRDEQLCDLVIVLSHLGNDEYSPLRDEQLAAQVPGIDVIIGGHSHQLIAPPQTIIHADGSCTYISQAAARGAYVGRVRVVCR